MANINFQPPNTGLRQLSQALPEQGVGGAVQAGIQGGLAGDRQQRANQAADELNQFISRPDNPSPKEIGEKAIEIGQKFNLPEVAQKGKRILGARATVNDIESQEQQLEGQEIQNEQRQQQQTVNQVRGAFLGNFMEAQGENVQEKFQNAFQQTKQQAQQLGVENPDSVVGNAVSGFNPVANATQNQGQQLDPLERARLKKILAETEQLRGNNQGQGDSLLSTSSQTGKQGQKERIRSTLKENANERGNFSEETFDASNIPGSAGSLEAQKRRFVQQSGLGQIGVVPTNEQFQQIKSLVQNQGLSEKQATEQVLIGSELRQQNQTNKQTTTRTVEQNQQQGSGQETVRIEKGKFETFNDIANAFENLSVEDIQAANPNLDPRSLVPGTEILIPNQTTGETNNQNNVEIFDEDTQKRRQRILTAKERIKDKLSQGETPETLLDKVRQSNNLSEDEKDSIIATIPELREIAQQRNENNNPGI